MRFVLWIPGLLLFLVLLGFAAKNLDAVTVNFFFDLHWDVPLVLLLFIFIVAGTLLGLAGALGTVFRQRREIGRLRRELGREDTLPAVRERA
jgi:lipopolysaccharide assembly protein A